MEFLFLIKQVSFLYREDLEPLLKYGHKLIKKGDIIIDGGANQGVFSLAFAKKVESLGRVVAVEPFSYCVDIIKKNARINSLKNITILKKCLFDKQKTLKIDYSNGVGSASIVRKFGNQKKIVKTITLDSVKKKFSLNKVAFIKLDIEQKFLH